jgi:hypothetical protein
MKILVLEHYFELRFFWVTLCHGRNSNVLHSVDELFCSCWEESIEAAVRLALRAFQPNASA